MKPKPLSAGKRLTTPVVFGTLLVGLSALFFNRHMFFADVEEIRAQEQARNNVRRAELLEMRQEQLELLREKKEGGGGGS